MTKSRMPLNETVAETEAQRVSERERNSPICKQKAKADQSNVR